MYRAGRDSCPLRWAGRASNVLPVQQILTSPWSSVVIGLLVVGWLCYRQLQTRTVKEDRGVRGAVILVAAGLAIAYNYLKVHDVDAVVLALTAGSLVIGIALGALRGRLVHLWREDATLYRRGNAVTVVIWIVGLAAHIGLDLLAVQLQPSAESFGSNTLLLYIALSLAAQKFVMLERAKRLDEHPEQAPTAY